MTFTTRIEGIQASLSLCDDAGDIMVDCIEPTMDLVGDNGEFWVEAFYIDGRTYKRAECRNGLESVFLQALDLHIDDDDYVQEQIEAKLKELKESYLEDLHYDK